MNIRKMEGTRVLSHEIGSGTEAKPQVRRVGATLARHDKGKAPDVAEATGSMKRKPKTRATTGGKSGY